MAINETVPDSSVSTFFLNAANVEFVAFEGNEMVETLFVTSTLNLMYPSEAAFSEYPKSIPSTMGMRYLPPAIFSGIKNVTATGNIRACGSANLA